MVDVMKHMNSTTSMFLAPTVKKESIFKNECLSNVLKRPQAVNTDMFGAISLLNTL